MSKFKAVPTPDHGTRLVPVDPTPKTEEEWLKAACEHDITYGEDPTPPGYHTPGPWELRGCRLVTDPHGVIIAEGISANHPGTPEANAHLIAAAPELLVAARDLVSMFERGYVRGQTESTGTAFIDGVDKMRAAIAKATGGAS